VAASGQKECKIITPYLEILWKRVFFNFPKKRGACRKRQQTIQNNNDTFVSFFENAYFLLSQKNAGLAASGNKQCKTKQHIWVFNEVCWVCDVSGALFHIFAKNVVSCAFFLVPA